MTVPKPRPSSDRTRAALWFAGQGFGVFPCWSTTSDGTCRCPQGQACGSPGKHPITNDGFKSATIDETKIRTFLSAASEPNYGLVAPEGVFVLDVDGDGWQEKLASLEAKYGPLPPTLRTTTGNGQHIYLRLPDGHPRPLGLFFGWIPRFGSGTRAGYVIGPRSWHASGAEYRPADGSVFEIATLPDAWAAAWVAGDDGQKGVKALHGPIDPATIKPGHRHEYLRDTARHFAGTVRDPDALFAAVMAANMKLDQPKTEDDVRRAIGDVLERFGPDEDEPQRRKPAPKKEYGPVMDAADLVATDFEPLRMIIPGLLPEGTAILAAPPKIGKSCLVYQMAVEVAVGGELFGERVVSGSALYLALEDGQRRGKERVIAALAGRTMPRGRLDVRWDAPKIGEGLEEMLNEWLDAHPDAAFVAIDTLGRVRPASSGKRNSYEVDVEDIGRLQDLFRDRPVALLLVHHTKKDRGDDFVAQVSGTYGVSGSVDTNIVIARKRLDPYGKVTASGREIPEVEIGVRFEDQLWTLAPEALAQASYERQEVYRYIEEQGPIHAAAISKQTGQSRESVQGIISALDEAGAVRRTTGGWVRRDMHSLGTPPSSTYSESNQRKDLDTHARVRAMEEDDLTVQKNPDSRVACSDFRAHQSAHRRVGTDFTCDICSPEEDA